MTYAQYNVLFRRAHNPVGAAMEKAYGHLNRAWKSTCKVILGREIGELETFEEWLSGYRGEWREEKSCLSGKPVGLGITSYCNGARFLSFEEIDFGQKSEPLTINQMKDIESIAQALGERWSYAGNVVMGNSNFVESSSNIIDSNFILASSVVSDSKYVSHSKFIRSCQYDFGAYGDGDSSHVIRDSDGFKNRRCFECHSCANLSDCYYCNRCQDCRECMFCFGAKSRSYCIGNLELPKDKYLLLKSRLLSQLSDELEKKKKAFSLFELVERCAEFPSETSLQKAKPEQAAGKEAVEAAFSRTSKLLLGKELFGLDNYSNFLFRNVPQDIVAKSAFSKRKVLFTGYLKPLLSSHDIGARAATEDEMRLLGDVHIGKEQAERLEFNLDAIASCLKDIAYISLDNQAGENINMLDCSNYHFAENCYRASATVYAKKCALSWWARESEQIFGSATVWASSFCIKGFYSKKLTRAFEVDSCDNSSDIYFSHNCENVQDALFCFNVKNQRFAIGNAQLQPELYRKLKAALLSQVASELEKKKDLRLGIYSIGEK